MRNFIISLTAVFAFWFGLSLTTAFSHTATKDDSAAAFHFVCTTLDVDCSSIEPPEVIYTQLMDNLGLLGLTVKNEGHVFVTADDIGEHMRQVVIVHEVTHYVLFELFPGIHLCDSEKVARLMEAAYTDEPYDDSWRELEFYSDCALPPEESSDKPASL